VLIQSKKELKKFKLNFPLQNYNLPLLSAGNHAAAILLSDVMICQSALMKILRVRTTAWRTCATTLKNGIVPVHGLIGPLPNVRAKMFEGKVGPKLKDFLRTI
jgi:hypothetical protein